MRIALIKPTIGTKHNSLYVDEGRMEPLQLGILAAMIPRDIETLLFDDRMERIDFDIPVDAVMITVETFTAKRAYEISEEYTKRGVKVVMGGIHPMLCPEEVTQHCDAMMVGDAETMMAQIVADLRSGTLRKIYEGSVAEVPQDGIMTRRDIYKGKGYLPISLMQFSRGCIHGCNYCAISRYFGQRNFCRRTEQVIEEIKSLGRKTVFFVDDNLVATKERLKELLREMIPLKLTWVSQGCLDMLQDDELMGLMVKSGCLGFVIGFESVSEAGLEQMNKGVNKMNGFDGYKWAVERLRYWGLQTWGSFTFGHDTDTRESILAALDFATKAKFAFAAFNVLMPYPGTPLYDKLKAEGRLLYGGKWWLHDDYGFNHAAFVPKNMTAQELTDLGMHCRREFNSFPSIAYRALDLRTNMSSLKRFITYCLYTPLFKKEVVKKNDMKFGLKHFYEAKRDA